MTKTHLIVIAVIAIVLLVIFGHSPMESIRKKQQERMNQSLVNKIMKFNDPTYSTKKPKTPPVRTNGVDFGGDTSADKIDTDAPPGQTGRGIYGIQNNMRSGIQNGGGMIQNNIAGGRAVAPSGYPAGQPQLLPNQAVQPMQPNQGTQPAMQAPANNDEYYPPTPEDSVRQKPQSSIRHMLNPGNNITLSDGTPIVFVGTKVYEVDGDGTRKPLKDGKYPMFDGVYTMTIRGGEKVI